MGLYSGGLIIGRIFASEIWGAYFREGLFCFLFVLFCFCFCFFFGGGGGGGGLLSEFYGICSEGLVSSQGTQLIVSVEYLLRNP